MRAPVPAPELRSVVQPKQARSQKSMVRLLEAAAALIERHGFDRVSVAEIARKAGSSVGGFYSRFHDKDELLLALHEQQVQELRVRVERLLAPEVYAGAGVAAIIRAAVGEMVRTYRERRHLFAAFASRAVLNPELRRRGLSFRREVLDRFTRLLLERRHEMTHPDPELAVVLGAQMLFAFMDQLVMFGDLGSEPLPDERLQAELERSFLAYVGVEAQ